MVATLSYDLLVIGGGINGAGIAADAAGRGLTVALCEKSDLAAGTSSASTKLIHGGLRYLENYEFGLVRKALKEREILTRAAPHVIRPLPFKIPILPHSRNSMKLRAGLLLYDNLARRNIYKPSRAVRFGEDSPLNSAIHRGFEYWDGQVDDARLVVLNALQAAQYGAEILTYHECTSLVSGDTGWEVSVKDYRSGEDKTIHCKAIVNAAGPWIDSLHEKLTGKPSIFDIRMVKGSHIVVPKIYEGRHAYMLQHHDGRVVFVIPWLKDFSLVGTTEQVFEGDLNKLDISREETSYLISIVNLYFKKSLIHGDVVSSFAGVRPLIDEEGKSASKVSRDYRLVLDEEPHPLLSVYGGKVTTYRVLAEDAMDRLGDVFPEMKSSWTSMASLPGGDFDMPENLFQDIAAKYSWLGADIVTRWTQSYGTLSFEILQDARSMAELGISFGNSLYQREVDYLVKNEWAHSVDDVLWRRTKLGLFFSDKETKSLGNYIREITAN